MQIAPRGPGRHVKAWPRFSSRVKVDRLPSGSGGRRVDGRNADRVQLVGYHSLQNCGLQAPSSLSPPSDCALPDLSLQGRIGSAPSAASVASVGNLGTERGFLNRGTATREADGNGDLQHAPLTPIAPRIEETDAKLNPLCHCAERRYSRRGPSVGASDSTRRIRWLATEDFSREAAGEY